MIHLISAVTLPDLAIGLLPDHKLPFSNKVDMQRFKKLTTGGIVVMGRVTYDSLGRENGLPNRTNIVISGDGQRRGTCHVVPSLEKAIQLADTMRYLTRVMDELELPLFIIGGARIYRETIERDIVDVLHLSMIKAELKKQQEFVSFPLDVSNVKKLAETEYGQKFNIHVKGVYKPAIAEPVTFVTMIRKPLDFVEVGEADEGLLKITTPTWMKYQNSQHVLGA